MLRAIVLPNVIETRFFPKSGTLVEKISDGRKLFTFAENSKLYKAGLNQSILQPGRTSGEKSVYFLREGKDTIQASKLRTYREGGYGELIDNGSFKYVRNYLGYTV